MKFPRMGAGEKQLDPGGPSDVQGDMLACSIITSTWEPQGSLLAEMNASSYLKLLVLRGAHKKYTTTPVYMGPLTREREALHKSRIVPQGTLGHLLLSTSVS